MSSSPSTTMASSSRAVPVVDVRNAVSPPQHVGMQSLDRSAFEVQIPILSVAVEAAKIGKLRPRPALRKYILDLPKVKSIVDSDVKGEKGIKLLRLRVSQEDELPEESLTILRAEGKEFRRETITMGYENWNTSEILSAVLPTTASDDIPSSFTSTGHIGHMNLREEWLPYKRLIGQVILDKNPGLRTIVNKLETIHAQYRYFDMEVLAGDEDYITTVNESDCTFTFDFSRVYWNSRLHHEHERLIALFKPGSLVVDVMAGVGPFAVPAAKRGCYVLGNDLNPESVKWMRENRVKNSVEDTLRVFEEDGHSFIKTAAKEAWERPFAPAMPKINVRKQQKEARREREKKKQEAASASKLPPTFSEAISTMDISAAANAVSQSISSLVSGTISDLGQSSDLATQPTRLHSSTSSPPSISVPRTISHFIMNLPDSALTFLGSYSSCLTPLLSVPSFAEQYGVEGEKMDMPVVHAYCFTREIEREPAELDICNRASEYLSYPVSPTMEGYNLHHVRSVAPNKDMYCLSFTLPREVAFRPLLADA